MKFLKGSSRNKSLKINQTWDVSGKEVTPEKKDDGKCAKGFIFTVYPFV